MRWITPADIGKFETVPGLTQVFAAVGELY